MWRYVYSFYDQIVINLQYETVTIEKDHTFTNPNVVYKIRDIWLKQT